MSDVLVTGVAGFLGSHVAAVDLRYRMARLCHRRISTYLALLARVGG